MDVTKWPHKVSEPKDPDALLDYVVDWSDWLAEGEVIVDSQWEVEGDCVLEMHTFTSTEATAWVSGGSVNWKITNHITTNSLPVAREDDRTLIVKVKHK